MTQLLCLAELEALALRGLGRNRTSDPPLIRRTLSPLSYGPDTSVTPSADDRQRVRTLGLMPNPERGARRDRVLQWFYYLHVIPLVAIAFLLEFELFTKISLVYTTTVSAVTAGATYGARGKAQRAEAAANS